MMEAHMNTKLQKTIREIERVKAQLAELQALLPELEKRKTDIENTEIIRAVRSVCVAPGDLDAVLAAYRAELTGSPAAATEPKKPANSQQSLTRRSDADLNAIQSNTNDMEDAFDDEE
jgi:hypothetical protein